MSANLTLTVVAATGAGAGATLAGGVLSLSAIVIGLASGCWVG